MRHCFSKILLAFVFVIGLTGAGYAADNYPSRPIHIIVPASAGSALDPASGVIGQVLTELWGQRVVIENRSGAGNTIGYEAVASAEPDGYTFLFSTATLGIVPSIYEDLPFDAGTDLKAVSHVATLPIAMVAAPSVPVSNLSELIALAKKEPGTLTFGSGGLGTTNDLAAVLMAQMAGIEIMRVPYQGASNAMTAILGDEIDFMCASTANLLPYIEEGTMKPIALTTAKRQEVLPDVPVIGETLPGYAVSNWYGLFAPKDLPQEILDKWVEALPKIKADPRVQKFYADAGSVLEMDTPQAMDTLLHHDLAMWKEVISKLPPME